MNAPTYRRANFRNGSYGIALLSNSQSAKKMRGGDWGGGTYTPESPLELPKLYWGRGTGLYGYILPDYTGGCCIWAPPGTFILLTVTGVRVSGLPNACPCFSSRPATFGLYGTVMIKTLAVRLVLGTISRYPIRIMARGKRRRGLLLLLLLRLLRLSKITGGAYGLPR